MPNRTWTKRQLKIMVENYPTIPDPRDLMKRLNKTYEAIKAKAGVLRLKRKVHAGHVWTNSMKKKLIRWYQDTTNEEIARRLSIKPGSVASQAFKLGLHKTKEFMYLHSMITAFRKGSIPENKGKKQKDYMSKSQIKKTIATRFKKGQIPHNARGIKDGDITVRYGSTKRGRIPHKHIRIKLGSWEELQIHNWKKKYGPIPKGHCLWCKDGNTLNCDPENWEIITRGENVKRNSGSLHLADGYVAFTIVGKNNMHLYEETLKNKKVIELKRQQLLLKRTINEQQEVSKTA
jgi:hypothetical protein